jgi:hypothetical protein
MSLVGRAGADAARLMGDVRQGDAWMGKQNPRVRAEAPSCSEAGLASDDEFCFALSPAPNTQNDKHRNNNWREILALT